MTAELVHGTRRGYRLGCKEECCRSAVRAYRKRYKYLVNRGLTSMVDAAPVRAHVVWLGGYGISQIAIARAAGVPKSTIEWLLHGKPSSGREPTQRMRRSNADKLLAVPRSLDLVADMGRTPAAETRERLRSLVAAGWGQNELADRIGMGRTHLNEVSTGRRGWVSGRTARLVRDVHAELQGVHPPRSTRAERTRYGQALAVARKRGWLVEQVTS